MYKDIYLAFPTSRRTADEREIQTLFGLTVDNCWPDSEKEPTGFTMVTYRVDNTDPRFSQLIGWANTHNYSSRVQDIAEEEANEDTGEPRDEKKEPTVTELITATKAALVEIDDLQPHPDYLERYAHVLREGLNRLLPLLEEEKRREEMSTPPTLLQRAFIDLECQRHDQPLDPGTYTLLHDLISALLLQEQQREQNIQKVGKDLSLSEEVELAQELLDNSQVANWLSGELGRNGSNVILDALDLFVDDRIQQGQGLNRVYI